MKPLLLIFVILGFLLNLGAPSDLTYLNKGVLVVEFIGVLMGGRLITNAIIPPSNNRLRQRCYNCFLLFLGLVLLYLALCWTPFLSPNSNVNWGFDPQRYYWYALNFARNTEVEFGLNYMGVVEIYKFIFYLFGIDPLVPLFVNTLLLYYTVLCLTKMHLKFYEGSKYTKYIPMFLLIPEIIAYGSMTSRECLSLVFCTLSLISFVYYISEKHVKYLAATFIAILLLFLVRPPFAFAAISVIAISLLLNARGRSKVFNIAIVVVSVFGIIALGSSLNSLLGSNVEVADIGDMLESKVAGANEKGAEYSYSANSIAARLIPHNPVEFVIFGAIRCLTYLIPKENPLAVISIGSFYGMSLVLTYATSILMFISIPAFLWSLKNYRKQDVIYRFSIIAALVYVLTVGFGVTEFIQDRYRIVYDFMFFYVIISAIEKIGGWKVYKNYAFKYIIPMVMVMLFVLLSTLI